MSESSEQKTPWWPWILAALLVLGCLGGIANDPKSSKSNVKPLNGTPECYRSQRNYAAENNRELRTDEDYRQALDELGDVCQ